MRLVRHACSGPAALGEVARGCVVAQSRAHLPDGAAMAASRTGTGGLGATRRAVVDGEARPDGLLWAGHRRVGKDWWLWGWMGSRKICGISPHQRHPHCPPLVCRPIPSAQRRAHKRSRTVPADARTRGAGNSNKAPVRQQPLLSLLRPWRSPQARAQGAAPKPANTLFAPSLKAAVVAAAGREVAVGIPVQTPGLLDGAGMRIIFKVGRPPLPRRSVERPKPPATACALRPAAPPPACACARAGARLPPAGPHAQRGVRHRERRHQEAIGRCLWLLAASPDDGHGAPPPHSRLLRPPACFSLRGRAAGPPPLEPPPVAPPALAPTAHLERGWLLELAARRADGPVWQRQNNSAGALTLRSLCPLCAAARSGFPPIPPHGEGYCS